MTSLTQYRTDRRQQGRAIKRHRRDVIACALLVIRENWTGKVPPTKLHGKICKALIASQEKQIRTAARVTLERYYPQAVTWPF